MLIAAIAPAHAAERCYPVFGSQVETVLAGNPCNSPIGLCLQGTLRGTLNGTSNITAITFLPTVDAATTGNNAATADISFQGRLLGRQGGLTIKDTVILSGTSSDGVALYTILGGSGQLTGATGNLRLIGTCDLAAGQCNNRFEGKICLP
jgi:hypothetical protein